MKEGKKGLGVKQEGKGEEEEKEGRRERGRAVGRKAFHHRSFVMKAAVAGVWEGGGRGKRNEQTRPFPPPTRGPKTEEGKKKHVSTFPSSQDVDLPSPTRVKSAQR